MFTKNSAQPLLENEIFEAIYFYQICNSKALKISPNLHADLLRFIFTGDSLRIKQGPGTSFQVTFFIKFSDRIFYFVMLLKLAKFNYQTVFISQVIQQNMFCVSCLGIFDDVMTFEYLKIKI